MSDGEVLPPTVPFTRGCKARSSLPVGRSSCQTRERPPGILYLQYGDETKKIRMPVEISSQDALEALFVTAFPHQLTVKMLQSPNMAIYIKHTNRNVYYDLEDIRNITSHSCLKVYHRDPAYVFNRHARPANTEGRISKEVLSSSHSPVHTLNLQGIMSPPTARSVPSSPSRVAYVGGSSGMVDLGSATLPRERLWRVGRSSSFCTSSSTILERRDVKPDDMALVMCGEGGPHYPGSYSSSLKDRGGGCRSMASSRYSSPPSFTADMVNAGATGIPGGLQQYRASIKPLMGYGELLEQQTPFLHRVNEVRMTEGQIVGNLASSERMSPIRRSLRRDTNGATVEILNRGRGSGSSSSTSSVFLDSPMGQPERLEGHVTAQSERMKAIEEQIASLASLVHNALSIGPDVPGVKNNISDITECMLSDNRAGVSAEPRVPAAVIESSRPAPLMFQAPPSDNGLQQSLVLAKRNVLDLRLQLNHIRHIQQSHQASVTSMLRMAGQELVVQMYNRLAQSEEAVYRRRAEMEEERIHYLATEKTILTQLRGLEDYVVGLQRSSTSSTHRPSLSLRDVEEGAVNLRRVGEALAVLQGELPELQVKMRSVLRLEMKAVAFLKEEPHKMDSMLKRVKALSEHLGCLHRCVSDQEALKTPSPQSCPKPQPLSVVRPTLPTPSLSRSHPGLASTIAGGMNIGAPVIDPYQHPSPPLTSTHGPDSLTVAKVTTELTHKNSLQGKNQQEEEVRTSPTSQMANRKPSELAASGYRSDDQDIPTTTQKKAEKTPPYTAPTVQKGNDFYVKISDQINNEVVGQMSSPTLAEKKVKFTTIVTLQKENIQASDNAGSDRTNEKDKEVPAEKKSNVMVVLTLQKEKSEDSLKEFQQDESLSSDQGLGHSPVLKTSPSLTYSSKQKNQGPTLQIFKEQSQYTEEGSSLSPNIWDDGGPPLPTIGQINPRISETVTPRMRTQSREKNAAEMSDADLQAVAGNNSIGEPTSQGHDNQGFQDSDDSGKKPIIIILNEPRDTQSAYKRLSTILECEGDLDGILNPEDLMDKEKTKHEKKKPNVRENCISEINTDFDRDNIKGNVQESQYMHNQRRSADNVSIPKNQHHELDSLRQQETKRKFRFKFPQNKLAVISQAIRTGMTKRGKKTLEVAVYEEEEENASDSGSVKETKKPTKECQRFETNSTKQFNLCEDNTMVSAIIDTRHSKSQSRVEEICSTFDSFDNLEESINQLEIGGDNVSSPRSPSSIVSSPLQYPDSHFDSSDRALHEGKVKREREKSLSKRPASQILKGPNPPQSKKAKPQPSHDLGKTSTKKHTSGSSSSSSAQRSHTKSRHSSSSCSPEKMPKGHKQPPQKQPSLVNDL
uniref:sickle tail protein-like isoform X3 n=1 Tax=Gasterosteus aculeatus aculeatus TaxID=481459 RepID=UPI001A9932CF|nr:sickle tail protein-like isoform X3 [Gasterosteus aculeatus aculeatus]